MDNPAGGLLVLDGDAEPDMGRRSISGEIFWRRSAPLHSVEDLGDMIARHLFVKEVAH